MKYLLIPFLIIGFAVMPFIADARAGRLDTIGENSYADVGSLTIDDHYVLLAVGNSCDENSSEFYIFGSNLFNGAISSGDFNDASAIGFDDTYSTTLVLISGDGFNSGRNYVYNFDLNDPSFAGYNAYDVGYICSYPDPVTSLEDYYTVSTIYSPALGATTTLPIYTQDDISYHDWIFVVAVFIFLLTPLWFRELFSYLRRHKKY